MNIAGFPELSHFEEVQGIQYFVTLDQRVGAIFRMPIEDLEGETGLPIADYLGRLKPGVTLKIISRTIPKDDLPWPVSRKAEVERLGWLEPELYFVVETTPRLSALWRIVKGVTKKASGQFETEISSPTLHLVPHSGQTGSSPKVPSDAGKLRLTTIARALSLLGVFVGAIGFQVPGAANWARMILAGGLLGTGIAWGAPSLLNLFKSIFGG